MFKFLIVVLSVLSLHAMSQRDINQRKNFLEKKLDKVSGRCSEFEDEVAAQSCSWLSRYCTAFGIPLCYTLSTGDWLSLSNSDLFVRFVTGFCMHESLNSLAECEDARARARFSEDQYEKLLKRKSCLLQDLDKLRRKLKQD